MKIMIIDDDVREIRLIQLYEFVITISIQKYQRYLKFENNNRYVCDFMCETKTLRWLWFVDLNTKSVIV